MNIASATNRLKSFTGIDLAISYVLTGKLIALGTQPLVLFLVGKYLTVTEQGFYFTFSNILSLSVFFELGLGTILTQFASYEFAALSWKDQSVTGDPIAMDRLFSLIRQSLRWYLGVALIFTLFIIPTGILFFYRDAAAAEIGFVVPWIILVVATALNLLCYALTSLLEGAHKISDVQFIKMSQSIIGSVALCALLYAKVGLYASAGFACVQFLLIVIWLKWKYQGFIKQIFGYQSQSGARVAWKREVLPLQWRIGLSWVSGYIIYQTINPALFKFRGPVEAGQMGMTLAIASLPVTVGMAWLTTKIPTYGLYIQRNQHRELLQIVKKNTLRACVIAFAAAIGILLTLALFSNDMKSFKHRMLPVAGLCALFAYNFLNLVINSMASYVRAFKIEPFMKSSIIVAMLTGLNIFICAKYFNGPVLCFSLLLQCILINFPISYQIYHRHQRTLNVKTPHHIDTHV